MGEFKILVFLSLFFSTFVSLDCSEVCENDFEVPVASKMELAGFSDDDFKEFACSFLDSEKDDFYEPEDFPDETIKKNDLTVYPYAYHGCFHPVLRESIRMIEKSVKDEIIGHLLMAYLFYRIENVEGLKGVFERLDATIEDRFKFSKGIPISIDLTKDNNQIYTNNHKGEKD